MTIALVEKLSDVRDFRKILETTVKEIGETYNADLSQIVLSNPLDTNITSICEYLSNPDEIPRAPALTTFPLTLEGGGLGVLNIARNDSLSLDEVNEIRITLAEIANIIRYAQINDLVQRDTFRSAFMSEISSMMQMNMGLGDTLFMVVNILGKALNCSRCIFVATDGSSGWKCYEYWQRERGVESSQDCGWPTKDSAVVARALLSPLPVVTFEGQNGSYLTPAQEEMQFIGVRSLLAVGIRSTLGVHGCIVMQQCDSRRAWTRDEMDMVQNVADTVADALVQLPEEKRNLEPIMRLHQRNVADTKDAEQQSIQDVRRALKGVLANASIPNARKAPTVAAPPQSYEEPEEGNQQQGYQQADYEQGIPPTPEQLAYAIESSGESTNAFGGLADMIADQAQQPVAEPEPYVEEAPQVMMPAPPPFDPTAPGQGGRTLTGLLGGIRTNARTGAASVGAWNITTSQPTPPMPGEGEEGEEIAPSDQIQPAEAQAEETRAEETQSDDIQDRIMAAIDAPSVDHDQAEEGANPIPKAFSGSWGLTDEYTKAKALQNAPTPASMRPAKPAVSTPAASVQSAEPPAGPSLDDLNSIPTPSVRSPGSGAPKAGLGQVLGRGPGSEDSAPVTPTPEPPAPATTPAAKPAWSNLDAIPAPGSGGAPGGAPAAGPGRPGPMEKPISRNDLDALGAPGKPKPASKWGDLESIPAPGSPAAAAAQVTPAMDFPEDQASSGNWGNLDAIPTPANNPGKGLGSAMLGKARMASISTPGGGLGSSFHKDRNRSGQFIDGPPLEIDEAAAEAKLKQILSTSNPTSDYIFATPGIDPRLLGRLDNWVSQVEQKDKYVNGHARAVAEYSTAVARLLGLTPEEVNIVRLAAIVHDIGKMKLPQSLLQKPDEDLSDAELVQTMEHPIDGAKLLKGIPELEELAAVVLYHHEEYDGNGYPEGLAGEDIPLLSRIVHAADGYHGRVSDLTYRAGMPPEDALEEMRQNAGILYDPSVVEALVACISQGLVPPII